MHNMISEKIKTNIEGLKMNLLLQWATWGSNLLHITVKSTKNKVFYMKFYPIEEDTFFLWGYSGLYFFSA